MTINELKAELTRRSIAFAPKAKKAELEALLAAAPAPAEEKKPRAKRASTKTLLRELFTQVGDELTIAEVVAHVQSQHAVQEATIWTMCGDLRNPKYAQGELIDLRKQGDKIVRLS